MKKPKLSATRFFMTVRLKAAIDQRLRKAAAKALDKRLNSRKGIKNGLGGRIFQKKFLCGSLLQEPCLHL